MKNTFGTSLKITVFGESHGKSIGAVIDGIAAGLTVDEDYIREKLSLRRPSSNISTPRRERDEFVIESGVFNSKTTGTPIVIRIPNTDTKSGDYAQFLTVPRPSHADFTAHEKYYGFEDFRGGGHFSGRITAALVAAGAIVMSILEENGIYIGTHIKRCAGIDDADFSTDLTADIKALSKKEFATLSDDKAEEMKTAILSAKNDGDSVGGILESVVVGIGTGFGEPFFDSVESILSHALFSIPAIKGVEFGKGFEFANMRGSEANDPFEIDGGRVVTSTNNSGGINGGITNGMPIVLRTVVRPTPTISREQRSVNLEKMENTVLEARGRHDPCIVHRARIVQDSVIALALYDIIASRLGVDWAVKK